MTRIVLIERDRALAQSVAMECIDEGIAIRMAETLCEGVRYMLDEPVSIILVDAALLRLSGGEQARMFDFVAPRVPVVVMVDDATRVEEIVKLEVQGFHVLPRPLHLVDVLAKVDPAPRSLPARVGAGEHVETFCR